MASGGPSTSRASTTRRRSALLPSPSRLPISTDRGRWAGTGGGCGTSRREDARTTGSAGAGRSPGAAGEMPATGSTGCRLTGRGSLDRTSISRGARSLSSSTRASLAGAGGAAVGSTPGEAAGSARCSTAGISRPRPPPAGGIRARAASRGRTSSGLRTAPSSGWPERAGGPGGSGSSAVRTLNTSTPSSESPSSPDAAAARFRAILPSRSRMAMMIINTATNLKSTILPPGMSRTNLRERSGRRVLVRTAERSG